jgi:hypothetical protein
MVIARRTLQYFQRGRAFPAPRWLRPPFAPWMGLGLCFAWLVTAGCGETAKPVLSPANGEVDGYFGGPFSTALNKSEANFDHFGNTLEVSGAVTTAATQVPVEVISATIASTDSGFLAITENLAISPSGLPAPQNPPLTGAWAVEIPGAGALANLLDITSSSTVSASPMAMAQNTSCPTAQATSPAYLYVTVPNAGNSPDTADYGIVSLATAGSAITFSSQPYLIGALAQTPLVVTGGCSITDLGPLIAYPLNSFGTASNLELVTVGQAGLLVSSYSMGPAAAEGAFGGGTGVIGVAAPGGQLDESAVVAAQYNGFIYDPRNVAQQPGYDITDLASSFGNHQASAPECSALQASLAANSGGAGNGLVLALPSANSIYGGEFLSTNGANDPTDAGASANCDVAIDLGPQDGSSGGLFPNATIFIGSTFPPFSAANPGPSAASFPAAAVVNQVLGKYVIFISASAVSTPPAQLPNGTGTFSAQPVGIYLFQK